MSDRNAELRMRKAVTKMVFADTGDDPSFTNFLFEHRNLATMQEGPHFELVYITEFYQLEAIVSDALTRIRERDGADIADEVAERLRDSIAINVEIAREKSGPKKPRK